MKIFNPWKLQINQLAPALYLATGETFKIEKVLARKINIAEINDNILASYDIVITNDPQIKFGLRKVISHLVQIPSIHFGGFHPDVVYMRLSKKIHPFQYLIIEEIFPHRVLLCSHLIMDFQ